MITREAFEDMLEYTAAFAADMVGVLEEEMEDRTDIIRDYIAGNTSLSAGEIYDRLCKSMKSKHLEEALEEDSPRVEELNPLGVLGGTYKCMQMKSEDDKVRLQLFIKRYLSKEGDHYIGKRVGCSPVIVRVGDWVVDMGLDKFVVLDDKTFKTLKSLSDRQL